MGIKILANDKLSDVKFGDSVTKSTQGQLKELEPKTDNETIFYPNDLEELDHWVSFSISKKWNWMQDELSKKEIQGTIFLPLPQNIATGYNINWESAELGVIGMTAANIGGDIGRSVIDNPTLDNAKRGLNAIKQRAQNISTSEISAAAASLGLQVLENGIGTAVGAITGGIGGAVATEGAAAALKGITAAAGVARNPHQAQIFQGVDFRTHNFQYKFVPRNSFESDQVRKIIALFKYHMSPGYYKSSHFLEYPETFDIDFKYDKYMFNIGNSVLKSFNVNYTGENTPVFHNIDGTNKAPFSVTVDMTFVETTITTKENILEQGR